MWRGYWACGCGDGVYVRVGGSHEPNAVKSMLAGGYPGVSYQRNKWCCVMLGVVCVYVYLGQAMGSVVRDIGVRCMVEMADALEKQRPQVLAT